MVGGVEIVHRSQTPLVPHEGEAATHIPRDPLVVMVVVVVVVMVRELVRDGGDGR